MGDFFKKQSCSSLLLVSQADLRYLEELNFAANWHSAALLLMDIDLKDRFFHTPEQTQLLKALFHLQNSKRFSVLDLNQMFQFLETSFDQKTSTRCKFTGTFEISPKCRIKTKIFSKVVKTSGPKVHKSSTRATGGFSGKVKSERVYFKIEGLNLKTVDKPNIQKGYEYGSSIIPIPKELESLLKYQDDRCLKLLAFVGEEKVPRHIAMTNVDVMMPVLDDLNHLKAFTGMVKNLVQMKKVALARMISRNKTGPKLVALIPREISAKEGKYCMYISQLPTVEDMRQFRFSSLKSSTSVQRNVVRDMISKMQLDTGRARLDLNRLVMPQSQIINSRLMRESRGEAAQVDPNKTLKGKYQGAHPDVLQNEELCRQLDLEETVREGLEGMDSQIQEAFELEENPELANNGKKRYWGDVLKENEKIMEEEQMIQKMKDHGKESIPDEISRNYTISDFNAMMTFRGEDLVDKAITQMRSIIIDIIKKSLSGSNFAKALECLKALRRGCVTEEEAGSFNEFLKKIRKIAQSDKSFYNFMKMLKQNGISLISEDEVRTEGVLKEVAEKFFDDEEEDEDEENQKEKEDEDLIKMLDDLD